MRKAYSAPSVSRLGTVHERTLQTFNKVGSDPDAFSAIVPAIVGSVVPSP